METKQVKFDLFNVSKTNDADLSSFSLVQSGVRKYAIFKVARLDFLGGILPKFERQLCRRE